MAGDNIFDRTAFQMLKAEVARQMGLWGLQNHPDFYWYGILGEEFGEAGKALIENFSASETSFEVVKEVIETCAVAFIWADCILRAEPRVLKPGFAKRDK